MGGQSLELLNSVIGQPLMARNRIPSLSTSTISSVEDDHSPRHNSYYHPPGPPIITYSEAVTPNVGVTGHGDVHSYQMNPMGQRPEWPGNVQMGIRQPTFDMYNNSGGFFVAPSPGYSSTGTIQPKYAAYNSRDPMVPSSGLSYDKMMYPQDSSNRQPLLSYGFQESFPGEPTLRAINQDPARDNMIHAHPNYLVDRRLQNHIPLQQSSARDLGDNHFVSLFGSSTNNDRGDSIPQDPYTIHDIRTFDSYRATAAANSTKAQLDIGGGGRGNMNPTQYAFPPNTLSPQSYVESYADTRSYPNINGGFPRQPVQNFVNPSRLYAFADPNMSAIGGGNSLYKMDLQNMIPNREVNLFPEQQPIPVVSDRLMDNLVLMQSSLHISSQATSSLQETRPYLDTEVRSNLSSNESQYATDPSKSLQQENLLPSEGKHADSKLLTTNTNLTGMEVSSRIQDDVRRCLRFFLLFEIVTCVFTFLLL